MKQKDLNFWFKLCSFERWQGDLGGRGLDEGVIFLQTELIKYFQLVLYLKFQLWDCVCFDLTDKNSDIYPSFKIIEITQWSERIGKIVLPPFERASNKNMLCNRNNLVPIVKGI
jgi:hypothetical protein